MNGLNSAFYFVVGKILELQSFFIGQAKNIGWVILLISICSAALNYGLTGTGLKENIIKIGKAVVFFFIVIGAYPRIVSAITTYTFNAGKDSTYSSMASYLGSSRGLISASAAKAASNNTKGTYGTVAVNTGGGFSGMFGQVNGYTTVAPGAVLQVVLITAGECLRFSDEAPKGPFGIPDFGAVLKGILCAFFVIFTGCFAVLEYLIAYLEFMFVSSVGIFLFPLSLWDGSKFMAEKFISALLGFFIKLLFSTICIFLCLYGFISLAKRSIDVPFMGLADEIIMIIATCLLFFYICKSAPAMAQSLLTGTPSLNAAGAIGAAASAVGAIAGITGMAMRGGYGTTAAVSKGMGAANLQGGGLKGAGAFMLSMGGSAVDAARTKGGDLTRSLMARPLFGPGGGGQGAGAGAGFNSHSATQRFLNTTGKDGAKKTFGEGLREQYTLGNTPRPKNEETAPAQS
ncbi:MAG: type IV secretion system protein [Treponema sp.]|jgi:hypothetical protein|nr:type IV secretion system protein [Treponema sp.]